MKKFLTLLVTFAITFFSVATATAILFKRQIPNISTNAKQKNMSSNVLGAFKDDIAPGDEITYTAYFYATKVGDIIAPINIFFGSHQDHYTLGGFKMTFTIKNIFNFGGMYLNQNSDATIYDLVKNGFVNNVLIETISSSHAQLSNLVVDGHNHEVPLTAMLYRDVNGAMQIANFDYSISLNNTQYKSFRINSSKQPNANPFEDRTIFAGLHVKIELNASKYFVVPYYEWNQNNSLSITITSGDGSVNARNLLLTSNGVYPRPTAHGIYFKKDSTNYEPQTPVSLYDNAMDVTNLEIPRTIFDPQYLFRVSPRSYIEEIDNETLGHLVFGINTEYLESALMAWDTAVNQAPLTYIIDYDTKTIGGTQRLTNTWDNVGGHSELDEFYRHASANGAVKDTLKLVSNAIIMGKLVYPEKSRVINIKLPNTNEKIALNSQYLSAESPNNIHNFIHTNYKNLMTDMAAQIDTAIQELPELPWHKAIFGFNDYRMPGKPNSYPITMVPGYGELSANGKYLINQDYWGRSGWARGKSVQLANAIIAMLSPNFTFDMQILTSYKTNNHSPMPPELTINSEFTMSDFLNQTAEIVIPKLKYGDDIIVRKFNNITGAIGNFRSNSNVYLYSGLAVNGTGNVISLTGAANQFSFTRPNMVNNLSFINLNENMLYWGWSLTDRITGVPNETSWKKFSEFIYSRKPSELVNVLNQGTSIEKYKTSKIEYSMDSNSAPAPIAFDANNFFRATNLDGSIINLSEYIEIVDGKLHIDWVGNDFTGSISATLHLKSGTTADFTTSIFAKTIDFRPINFLSDQKINCFASEFFSNPVSNLHGSSNDFLLKAVAWRNDMTANKDTPKLFTSSLSYEEFFNCIYDKLPPKPFCNDLEGSITVNILTIDRVLSTSDYLHVPQDSSYRKKESQKFAPFTQTAYAFKRNIPSPKPIPIPTPYKPEQASNNALIIIVVAAAVVAFGILTIIIVKKRKKAKMLKEDAEDEKKNEAKKNEIVAE